jgi:hypothetical protein
MKKRLLEVLMFALVFSCTKESTITEPGPSIPEFPYKIVANSDLVLNEICMSNDATVKDENNDDPDWIELFNKADSAINLKDYGVSDDTGNIFKWKFGDVVIPAKSYLLLFASGKNNNELKPVPAEEKMNIGTIAPWTDAASGGRSTVGVNEYPNFAGPDVRNKVISAKLTLVDNRPNLDWSSVNLTVGLSRAKQTLGNNFTMYNTLAYTMTLDKGKRLAIRLNIGSLNTWCGPQYVFTGTGIKDDIYKIPLVPGFQGLDLTKFRGLYIEAPQNQFTTVAFTISKVTLSHSGYALHTNFTLSGNDRMLFLTRPDSLVCDTVSIKALPVDISAGRVDGNWRILKKPTPGTQNENEYYLSMSQIPQAATKSGFYANPVAITLNSNSGEDIHYTTDGSVPDLTSRKYAGPIVFDTTSVLRFASYKEGLLMSAVQTETYFINVDSKVPVISITANPELLFDSVSGIFEPGPAAGKIFPFFGANFWQDIDVSAHIQFFENNKNLGFNENVALSILGNWSRAFPKKSIEIKFQERFGKTELKYPLFPDHPKLNKFKKFVLRNNGSNFGRAMIEDPMMQSLLGNRDVDYQKYRPAVVFINGRYFGLYALMEPANTDYMYTNYNLDKNELDFFDPMSMMKWGSADTWNDFISYLYMGVNNQDSVITDSLKYADYLKATENVDVNNFIDYMCFQIYINNTDWPAGNCRYWRNSNGGKWRWLVFDTDFGFGNEGHVTDGELVSNNTLSFALNTAGEAELYPNGRNWTFPLRALLQNQMFKENFINRLATLMATNFEPARVKARIDFMADEIKDEIPKDFNRWNLKIENWAKSVNNLKKFADERPAFMYEFIQKQFNLAGTFTLKLTSENGLITINDMSVNSNSFSGKYFINLPVRLTAIPQKGKQFKQWSDGTTANPRVITTDKDTQLSAIFE